MAVSFRQFAGQSGYILAKTNGDGSIRYYALYSSQSGTTCDFYYTVMNGGNPTLVRERFNAVLNDGNQHTLRVVVERGVLYFALDAEAPIARLLVVRFNVATKI